MKMSDSEFQTGLDMPMTTRDTMRHIVHIAPLRSSMRRTDRLSTCDRWKVRYAPQTPRRSAFHRPGGRLHVASALKARSRLLQPLYDHVEVYLDESGDLGFSQSSSKHFVLVAIACCEPNELKRMVRRVKKRRYPQVTRPMEFKFGSSPEIVRRQVCAGIARSDVVIAWGSAFKPNIPTPLRGDKNRLYLNICGMMLPDLTRNIHTRSVNFVLDKWSNSRTVMARLDEVVVQTVNDHHCGYFVPRTVVSHLDSSGSEGIQAADFVAGAVFQSLERSNDAYLGLISGKVVSGRNYW